MPTVRTVLIKDDELLSHQHCANGVMNMAPDSLWNVSFVVTDQAARARAAPRASRSSGGRLPPLAFFVLVSVMGTQ